ncbi:MAG: hypothetical protein ACI8S3_000243 [Alphaproteobacteria bacterium]|jgi:hypothetical protein
MAKKKYKPATRRRNTTRVNRRGTPARGGLYVLMLGFSVLALGLLVVAAPALIVLFVGMAPTAVAILIDRAPEKHAAISVATLNFAGVSPYLVDFLSGTASFSKAIELVADVFILVVIYGAAAAGWVLIMILPPVSAIVLSVITDSRIQTLRKEQKQLVEDWGEGVTGR